MNCCTICGTPVFFNTGQWWHHDKAGFNHDATLAEKDDDGLTDNERWLAEAEGPWSSQRAAGPPEED